MDKQLADEIVGMLPQGRTCFNYYPERYAWLLLRHVVGEGASVAALKQSPFAALLQKPRVKAWLAQLGGKRIGVADVVAADGDPQPLCFTLSLGHWDGQQTTRGATNLVLQLNFDRGHDRRYRELLQPTRDDDSPFVYGCHPVNESGRNTLAWARLDVDLDAGEVLIEEIQNDWLREAAYFERRPEAMYGIAGGTEQVRAYLSWLLARYRAVWAEAMLAATVWFVREELGLRRLFYHSPASNVRLKGISPDRAPPRSLYTDLPRQFCFRPSSEVPRFLAGKRSKIARNAPLYALQLEKVAA
ncbi:hypothetical protein [Chitiniphilus shinanonensis]|uniref:hypothetical protein n=1 Tax=Chitiniphilus shinanonensis TaxID=553088 RepID=UPI003041921F